MAIEVREKWSSRKGTRGLRSRDEIGFMVKGTTDDAAAKAALADAAPEVWDGNPRDDISVEQIGHDLWLGTVTYLDSEQKGEKEDQVKELGDETFSFRTSGGTKHVTQSLNTRSYAPAGSIAAIFNGAINVSGDDIGGTDVPDPILEFTIEKKVPLSVVLNPAYVKAIARMVAKTNAAPFRGFDIGEVLYLGCNGRKDGRSTATLSHEFRCGENARDLEIGGITQVVYGSDDLPVIEDGIIKTTTTGRITGIVKGAHEYLWVHYISYEDMNSKRMVKRAHTASVEQLFRPGDFGVIGVDVHFPTVA